MPSAARRLANVARQGLILTHRYLGIALGLMLVMWFASGIVMIYAGSMPQLDAALRLERLPPLDLARVTLTPDAAARRLGADDGAAATLTTVQDRPAYHFVGAVSGTVFADDGQLLDAVDAAAAQRIAARFADLPASAVHFARTLTHADQWTLGRDRQMPLHEFRLEDGRGTRVYVSSQRAEVVQLTTRRTRALAWAGTIPHWLYFAALRKNQPLWYDTVVWLSSACCVLAVLGLTLAFTQFRRTRPFRLSRAIPYRGWMRWHYIGGALFGATALTWAFSGLLSMEPFAWTNTRGLDIDPQALAGGPTDLAAFGASDAAGLQRVAGSAAIKEVGFTRIQGEHYYRVFAGHDVVLVSAATLQPLERAFSTESIIARLSAAVPEWPIAEQRLLEDYDSYYYARDAGRSLPVLRVKFADPMQTWVYVDLHTSDIVAQVHRDSRRERWLYNGLHSLDFKFWYGRRPWWDLGVITLLLGGLATSALGTYLGIRRLVVGGVNQR